MTLLGPRQGHMLLLVVLILSLAGTAVTVANPATNDFPQQTTPTNSTTIQQEDPSTVSQNGDSQQVSQWLQSQLTRQLEGSAANISEGQYEQAQHALGDDYEERYGQYVDVAGDTDSEVDDQTAETLNETRREQQALANATQSYNETFQAYQEARANGNTTAARQAARDLETLAERINRLNGSVNRNYERLENQTDVDTDRTQSLITNTSRDVQQQQDEVRTATFTQTRLNVTTNSSSVAFDAPLTITGQVTTDNGTAVENRTVPITVHNRNYEPRTDSDGEFTLSYHPVTLPVNATNVSIAYRPRGGSPYLGTNTTTRVNVTQVTPTMIASIAPITVQYGRSMSVTATVTVDGRPVPMLPLRSTFSGAGKYGNTTSQGRMTVTQTVPIRASPGEQSFQVTTLSDDMAIGPVSTAPGVTVRPTATNATVNATVVGTRIRVDGRILTATNRPVSRQRVQIGVGNQTWMVTTNQNGRYRATLTNGSRTTDDSLLVTVQFNGTGTSLEPTETNTTVANPWTQTSTGSVVTERPLLTALILFGLALILSTIAWSRYDGTPEQSTPKSTPEATEQTAAAPEQQPESWLPQARSALSAGEFEQAVVAAYASARRCIEAEEGVDDGLTHREFVVAVENTHLDSDQIRVIADAYEQVLFAGTAEDDAAAAAVAAADAVTRETDE